MASIQELLQELEHETGNTRETLKRVPANKFDWRPHPKSLSFGQLAMHVATLPGASADLATRTEFEVSTPIPRPNAASVEQLLEMLDQSVASARTVLGAMSDDDLSTPWRMMRGDAEVGALPRGAFLRSILFNHWYHHRGQLTVYLRETGAKVPAIYGDSADEKPFPPPGGDGGQPK
jgi:uncharacterized damage-inducible protein DinB